MKRWRCIEARSDLAVAAPVVEPVDIGESRELDVVDAAPWVLRVDELLLKMPVERLVARDGRTAGLTLRSNGR